MIVYFDARGVKWQSLCNALVAFSQWRQRHSGYCYIRAEKPLRNEIMRLCTHLDLDDAYSFAEDDVPALDGVTWADLSTRWEPPKGN